MSFPEAGWATYSFVGAIGCLLVAALLCLWMYLCYYPGGRLRRDVIDIGELPKYNLSGKDEEIFTDDQSREDMEGPGGVYYEMGEDEERPRTTLRPLDPEEMPVRRGVQMMEI